VGHELVVLVAATDAHPFVRECNGSGLVSGSDEILRPAIERDMELGTRKPRALDNRLEVTGQKSLALAQTRDANGPKIPFEEGARGIRILWPQFHGVAAHVQQRGRDLSALVTARRLLPQRLAAGLIGCESSELIIGRPARELGPLHRLELAAREFQGPFRGGAAADNAHDRAKKARDQRTPKGLRTRPTVPHANKCMREGNGSAARASMPATVNWLPRRRAGKVMLLLRCAATRRRRDARPTQSVIRAAQLSPSAAYCT